MTPWVRRGDTETRRKERFNEAPLLMAPITRSTPNWISMIIVVISLIPMVYAPRLLKEAHGCIVVDVRPFRPGSKSPIIINVRVLLIGVRGTPESEQSHKQNTGETNLSETTGNHHHHFSSVVDRSSKPVSS
jgi:hypothetical protein